LGVAFSSSSFQLSEESVGLALQCCIGGDHLGFKVLQLSDRRFRFSVASNKVGHFIYGLRDRVWLDFICHFSLYHVNCQSALGFLNAHNEFWFLSGENIEIAQRSPTKLKPDFSVLVASAKADTSSSSRHELARFGFQIPDDRVYSPPASFSTRKTSNVSSSSPTNSSPAGFIFGSFSEPVFADQTEIKSLRFVSKLRAKEANLARWKVSFQNDLQLHRYRLKSSLVRPLQDWMLSCFS
jgi:hypothetical protein